MTSFETFSGRLLLSPGQALPGNIRRLGVRRAERLAVGRPATAAPALLGTLFTLCGHAHTLTARRAIEAAQAAPGTVLPPPAPADRRQLQLRTAQEQLRRLLVDAPPVVDLPAATPAQLKRCPLWQPGPDPEAVMPALRAWMEADLLAMPLPDWLAAWEADGAGWLKLWTAQARSPVARLLRRLWPWAAPLHTPHRALHLEAHDGSAPALAARLAAEAPLQGGAAVPYATGPWCRAHGRDAAGTDNAWMLFASRLTDLVRLASPDGPATGAGTLASGAMNVDAHTGLAWTETARGLLVHRVALTPDGAAVAACRAVSPTDWNFDPHGPAATALQAVREQPALRSLVLAFDPCVAWEAREREASAEGAHA